ncbi:DoxX family protein [Nocardioides sp. GCM10027113]|uniref:DoxX family protein n=1 Tax=unclassified Nocardioides TaxID=2615069 RepID=UPI00360CFFE1
MTVIRLIARPMLASMFVVGGATALKNAPKLKEKATEVTERLVPRVQKVAPSLPIPEDPVTLVRINGAVQVAAGLALATGRAPRLSSATLAVSLLPTTVAGHQFWRESDPAKKQHERLHFFKNVSMLGGLLIASVDTEGRPGMAWRARRAAKDVRREARHLGRAARREAKLAAAQVS